MLAKIAHDIVSHNLANPDNNIQLYQDIHAQLAVVCLDHRGTEICQKSLRLSVLPQKHRYRSWMESQINPSLGIPQML